MWFPKYFSDIDLEDYILKKYWFELLSLLKFFFNVSFNYFLACFSRIFDIKNILYLGSTMLNIK